jgi:hypothetical protein
MVNSTIGVAMIVLAVAMLATGWIAIRKIVDIEV